MRALEAEFEQLQILRDPDAGVVAAIAVHSTRLGPAFGGIRRWRYETLEAALEDVLRLARSMTRKAALAGLAAGGGKAVVIDRPDLDGERAYRLIGRYVQQMGGRFYTGPDVGTEASDLAAAAAETEFCAHGDLSPAAIARATAVGVMAGVEAAVECGLGGGLAERHVVIQGVGAVGAHLARMVAAAGGRLSVADVDAERAAAVAAETGAEVVAPEAAVVTRCDVFAPCALGGVIDVEVARELPAGVVAGSANNPLIGAAAGRVLHERGVLYAPDFAISAGGLLHGAVAYLEGAPPPESRLRGIGDTLREVFARAQREGRPPIEVAEQIADERVAAGGESHRT